MRKAKQATTAGEGILLAGAHLIWTHLEAPKLDICNSNLMIWDNLIAPENSLLKSETIIWKFFSVIRLELSATDLAEHMDLLFKPETVTSLTDPWSRVTSSALLVAWNILSISWKSDFSKWLVTSLYKGYDDTVVNAQSKNTYILIKCHRIYTVVDTYILGKPSWKKKCFLLGIARKGGGGRPLPEFF